MHTEISDSLRPQDLLIKSIPHLYSLSFPDLPWNIVFNEEFKQLFLDEADQ